MDEKILYFAGAVTGDRVAAGSITAMIRYIQSLNIKVLSEHIAEERPNEFLAAIFGKKEHELTAEDIETQDITWLNEATHVIAEITGPSTGTGREVEYARTKGHFGKIPAEVLCLYQLEKEMQASKMIRGMKKEKYPNVTVRVYKEIEEAKEIIKKFLNPPTKELDN